MHAVSTIASEDKHDHGSDKEHHEEHHDDRESGLDAHEHGHAKLNVVVDQAEVHIEFHVPAMNLVGFEHTPETPEQKEAIAGAVEQLEQADTLFEVDEAADCNFSAVTAEHHEPEEGGEHSEFEASYTLECAKPEKLTQLAVPLFDVLEGMEEIEVQLVTPSLQTMVEVTESEKTIPLAQ